MRRQIFWAAMLTASVKVGKANGSSATCSLERCLPYLQKSRGTREYMCMERGIGEDVLWMLWIADFV